MGKVIAEFVLCVVVAVIVISEKPATTDAFLEPFASQFIAKKMLLKQALVPVPAPQPVYYGGHYQHHPRPSPPPPQQILPSYPAYGPPSPPIFSGYEPASVVKPHSPVVGCLPNSNPSSQIDYSQYNVHGGHGFGNYGNYGNEGNNGNYGK